MCNLHFAGFTAAPSKNGILLSQMTKHKVAYQRDEQGETEDSKSYDCSKQGRLRRMQEACEENPIDQYEYTTPIGRNNTLFIIVVDDRRKILYCKIGKTGTTSFLDYFAKTTGKPVGSINVQLKEDLRRVDLNMSYHVAVSEVNTRYKDYTKIIVVRHPLQRVISAYFHVFKVLKLYASMNMTLHKFLRNVTGNLADYDGHWTRYHNRCKVCRVKYDYIMKSETIDIDIMATADLFGVSNLTDDVKPVVETKNIGKRYSSEMFRYDDLLKDFQLRYPLYMHRLLHLYKEDMELFDYGWDIAGKKSRCRASINSRQCCT